MNNENSINLLSVRIGFWSSIFMLIAMLAYAIGLGIFIAVHPIPIWTDLQTFLKSIDNNWIILNSICQFIGFLCAPISILLLNSIHDYAENSKKILTRIGICFTIVFTVLSSIAYFTQFTLVRQNIIKDTVDNLELFINFNPNSFTSALTILGWNLFAALSFIFIAPVFYGNRLNLFIRILLILIGIFSIIGLIGAILEIYFLFGLYQITVTVLSIILLISFSIFFRKIEKDQTK